MIRIDLSRRIGYLLMSPLPMPCEQVIGWNVVGERIEKENRAEDRCRGEET
jgi:hypothetical protein